MCTHVEGSNKMYILSKILKCLKKRKELVKTVAIVLLALFLIGSVRVTNKYKKLQEEVSHSMSISNEVLKNQNEDLNVTINEQQNRIEELEAELKKEKTENEKLLKNAACSVTYPDTEYLQATYVWNYLKNEIGLNDYVAAGIMGNIMVEVGGQTLDISKYSCRESNGGRYYGMCQWAGPRKERLLRDFGRSLEAQCKFLQVELFEVISKDNSFYNLTDEKEAALYFAQKYERCATWSYGRRQTSATTALQYFTSGV